MRMHTYHLSVTVTCLDANQKNIYILFYTEDKFVWEFRS